VEAQLNALCMRNALSTDGDYWLGHKKAAALMPSLCLFFSRRLSGHTAMRVHVRALGAGRSHKYSWR